MSGTVGYAATGRRVPLPKWRFKTKMNLLSLTPSRQQLVTIMQRLRYGRIEHLPVVNGDPVLQKQPRTIRNLHLGKTRKEGGSPRESDFQTKRQIDELFELFDRKQTFEVERLEIQDGLPFAIDYSD